MTRAVPGASWLLLLALVAVPFAIRIEVERLDGGSSEIHVPLVDLTIWGLVFLQVVYSAVVALRTDRRRPLQRLHLAIRRAVAPELLAFVAVVALGLVISGVGRSGATDLVQIVDYFLVWYFLVAVGARRAPGLPVLAYGTIGLVAVFTGFATWQIWTGTPPYLVRSLFRDHQSYLSAFVILAPLAWCAFRTLPEPIRRFGAPVLFALGCATLGSIGTAVLVWIAIAAASLLHGERPWRPVGAVVAATLAVFVLSPTPYRLAVTAEAGNGLSVASAQRREEVRHAKWALLPIPPSHHFTIGGTHVFVGSETDPLRRFSFRQIDVSGRRVIHDYHAESWAALRLVTAGPLFGYGLGSWLDWIGTAYGTLERTGTAYPNNSNGYLGVGVTTGAVGLAALCFALAGALRRTHRRLRRAPPGERPLLAGCVAGLGGGAVMLLFCQFAFQPLAAYWIFLAALAHGAEPAKESP